MNTVRNLIPSLGAARSGTTTGREAATLTAIEWLAALTTLAVLLLLPLFLKNFVIFQITTCLIYAIAILSLNVLTGISGQFSLGHSAFYGIGAYSAGILMERYGANYVLAIPAAGIITFAFGFLFGMPVRRLSNVYLALATFALAVAMPKLLKLGVFEHWTGGVQGLVVSKPDAPFGLATGALFGLKVGQDVWFYYVTLAVSLLIYWASVNLVNSRSGRALLAIRDNPIAASAMGVNLGLFKTLAFGISAGMTGIAGALGAIVVQFVAPDGFTLFLAIALFLGMVVGGVGWLPGSLAGAIFMVFVPNIAESFSKGLSGAVFGIILLLIIFVIPHGARQLAYALRDIVATLVSKITVRKT